MFNSYPNNLTGDPQGTPPSINTHLNTAGGIVTTGHAFCFYFLCLDGHVFVDNLMKQFRPVVILSSTA